MLAELRDNTLTLIKVKEEEEKQQTVENTTNSK